MADTTKAGYLGLTTHWIDADAQTEVWTLRSEVVGFCALHGTHAGNNLGCYFMGLCDRVGIMLPEHSKVSFHIILLAITLPSVVTAPLGNAGQHIFQQYALQYG